MAEDHTTQEMISRARGAFIGLAVGDALGAPAEFMTSGEIKAQYRTLDEMVGGGWLRLKPGEVTDDTQMSLAIARAVAASGRWDLKAVADNFAGWLRSKPIDVGDTCRRGIRNYMLKGTLETPPNEWDAGNGAVMRMLPAALLSVGSQQLLERYAVEQAHLTHNHPLSDAACVTFGAMMHLALGGRSKVSLRTQVDALIERMPTFHFEPYKGLATGYVVDTMQTVFHFFFKTRSFEDCVVETVNQGGDSDTTGAIAGALAGAYYGAEEIPKRWMKKMDKKLLAELAGLAEKLVTMSPKVRQG